MSRLPVVATLVLSAALASAAPAATREAAVSGQYDNLILAVSGDTVSGVFSDSHVGGGTESAPQFSCIFLLHGRLHGQRSSVATWYPGDRPDEVIRGELALGDGDATLTLREQPGGCSMTGDDFVRDPQALSMVQAHPEWIGVALVAAPRAAFRQRPGAPAPRTPYVIRGDAVAVLERRGRWVRVGYPAAATPVSGWLRADELAPGTPPTPPRGAADPRVERAGGSSR